MKVFIRITGVLSAVAEVVCGVVLLCLTEGVVGILIGIGLILCGIFSGGFLFEWFQRDAEVEKMQDLYFQMKGELATLKQENETKKKAEALNQTVKK